MFKLTRLLNISILLIYFTFIYSQQEHPVRRRVLAADADEPDFMAPSPPQAPTQSELLPDDKFSQQDKRKHVDNAREGIRRLFKLKEKPSDAITTSNTKLHIPRAMLEEYLKGRDEVKQFIPDDRDFFGKIDIDGLDYRDENFWNQVHEQSGSYDLEVDMKSPDKGFDESQSGISKRDADHQILFRLQSEPEEVPKHIQPQLPPHVTSARNQKQYMSVHLNFNLSQSIYSQLATHEELSTALLYLTFDKINNPLPSSSVSNQKSSSNNSKLLDSNSIRITPRLQRIFILLITGYDEFNEPTTNIFTSRLIDTRNTADIVMDVKPAVNKWLEDPSKNYGLIVRVANEDDLYEEKRLANIKRSKGIELDELNTFDLTLLEQVRLKRGFGGRSDDEDSWMRKQPYILAFHKPPEQERHVKRHVGEDDTDGMQSDDPSVSAEYQQTSTSTASSRDTQQTDKPSSANLQASTFEPVTKREHSLTASNSRRGHLTRTSGNGRASSPQQGGTSQRPRNKPKPSLRQPDKCSKKPLKIDFDEVGWSSWIIAPHSFYANYCSGECTWPLSDTQNATNHAIIQAIYHSVGRVVPKSCCAPVKLARMAILYQLDGVVQMRQYDDMIIEACGCL